jgi:glyceraldehyde 3-phosphate dehydrogenase
MIRCSINGLGRIGKAFLRAVMQDPQARKKLEVVAINIGPGSLDLVAHTFKYDTLMGTYQGSVELDGTELVIDGHRILLYKEMDPERLPWKQLDMIGLSSVAAILPSEKAP